MPRKEEAASLWERGLGTDGASWDLPGTGLEKETLEVKDGVSSPGRFRICS